MLARSNARNQETAYKTPSGVLYVEELLGDVISVVRRSGTSRLLSQKTCSCYRVAIQSCGLNNGAQSYRAQQPNEDDDPKTLVLRLVFGHFGDWGTRRTARHRGIQVPPTHQPGIEVTPQVSGGFPWSFRGVRWCRSVGFFHWTLQVSFYLDPYLGVTRLVVSVWW